MRRLPLREVPAPNESFASYVDRLAAAYELPLIELLRHVGLLEHRAVPLAYGVTLSKRSLQQFAVTTGLDVDEVRALLLERFDQRALDLTGLDVDDPSSVRRVARREWAYFSGSHFCPECLGEEPV